jgi:hypothetical protein
VAKLRNIGPGPVSLYRPAGDPGSLDVEPGQVVETPGELAGQQPYSDAILIDSHGELRAWPTSTWETVEERVASTSPATDDTAKSGE